MGRIAGALDRVGIGGRTAFAAVTIALGVAGLASGGFAPIWQAAPKRMPAREVLVYLSGSISLLCGIALLWRRTARVAAGVLLVYLLAWLLLFRVPRIVLAPLSQEPWSGFGETAVLVAAAGVLYAKSATGLRVARSLFGLSLIPFGLGHFAYAAETASLVPSWLPLHLGWAYLTGCAYIAAGVAVLTGVLARWAAVLVTWQMGLFTLLIWVPVVAARANAFQWSEFAISVALTAGAWVVADSYAS